MLPDDLHGKRALDVGTFDGFWAFELERRGAEVVAIDVERVDGARSGRRTTGSGSSERCETLGVQLGGGFELAAAGARTRARRRVVCDVLELTPEAIGGPVDVAFMGALLIHLRDPVLALERVFGALEPGGELVPARARVAAAVAASPAAAGRAPADAETPFNWWRPNWATLKAWLETAGFTEIRRTTVRRPPQRRPMRDWMCGIASRRPRS